MDLLNKIVDSTKRQITDRKKQTSLSFFKSHFLPSKRDFKKALLADKINIIAEIKKASPIRGVLNENFDHFELFRAYSKHAAAISVITEEQFFQGNLSFLSDLDKISVLPLLRKDFIIDDYQIYESRYYGADAILLIARLLSVDELKHFQSIAKKLTMATLVEVHAENDLWKAAVEANSVIIGVNSRNLRDFTCSLDAAKAILALLPSSIIRVAESSIKSHEDITGLLPYCHNFLIGSSLVSAEDPEKKLRTLMRRFN